MKSYVYSPEYLGCQSIEITQLTEAYQVALFSYVTFGGIGAAAEKQLSPISTTESNDARKALSVCRSAIDSALLDSGCDEEIDTDNHTLLGLRIARLAIDNNYEHVPDLNRNSYEIRNKFTEYHSSETGLRTVVSLPDGLRSFISRVKLLNSRIAELDIADEEQTFRRYSDINAIKTSFPCLDIPDTSMDEFELSILNSLYRSEKLPDYLSSKQVDKIISLIGGGTLLKALDTVIDEHTSPVEARIKQLAKSAEARLGRGAFRATALGRTAWGVNSIRLRAGDDIPKVTFPKPGL